LAKKHLESLRDDSIKSLQDNGLMLKPIESVLHMNVMPWLFERVDEFLHNDDSVVQHSKELLHEGVLEA